MGTRSHTYIVEGETPIGALYRQCDGYVDGHGKELARFLSGHTIVNGFGSKSDPVFNGIGDLGVRLFTHLKGNADEVGNFYLIAPTVPDSEEYGYYVSIRDNAVHVVVTANGERIFAGTPEELLTFEEGE